MSKKKFGNKENDYKLNDFFKKHKRICIVLLAIPFAVLAVFLCIQFWWQSDISKVLDWGSFLGGTIAYIGTALLGIISVWQNERIKQDNTAAIIRQDMIFSEQRRLAIKPYLFPTVTSRNEKNRRDGYFFVITEEDGKISAKQELPSKMSIAQEYSIKNIGGNSAIGLSIELNGETIFGNTAIAKDDYINIYFDFRFKFSNLKISYNFFDVDGNKYTQEGEISFGKISDMDIFCHNTPIGKPIGIIEQKE